jgi:4-amino-4-deoxy-L-arabinose transferase-like glycosyltransferase
MEIRRWQRLALCALATALLYLPRLGHPPLWEPDEGRYAEIPREMIVTGDFVTPRDDFVRYFEKPPLVYWMTAASIEIFGRNEFAVRLPAALFSIGQVVVTAALGEAMLGPSAGFAAAAALALSPLFFGFARFITLDPALAFFVTVALAAFFMAIRAPTLDGGKSRRWMVLAAAMLALGTLAKGPVALVLGGGVALIDILLERRLRDFSPTLIFACAFVYAVIAFPWFVIVAMRNPSFVRFFFVHEHLQRYLVSTEHRWGPYFFVALAAAGTWPWIWFAPLGAVELARGAGQDPGGRRALRFLLSWFGFVLIFFSIPSSKLGSYILPGIPPLAILAGCGMARLEAIGAHRRRRVFQGLALVTAVFAIGAMAVFLFARRRLGAALSADAEKLIAGLMIEAFGALLLGRRRVRTWLSVIALAAGVAIVLGAALKARGDAAASFSYRGLAREVTPYVHSGCLLASYRHFVQSLPFYTGEREALVGYRGELAPFGDTPDATASFIANDIRLRDVWESSRCVVLIADQRDLAALVPTLDPRAVIIGCGGKKFALFNRPAATRQDCHANFSPAETR